jgi:hypothetical protein
VDVVFARMKEHLERLKAEGWNVVYPPPRETEPLAVRDEPPKHPSSALPSWAGLIARAGLLW